VAELDLAVALVSLAIGVAVGVASALFGIGGGLLMVPYLVALGAGQHLAEGTSLLVIVPTAIAGTIAHHKRGYVSFRHAWYLVPGGVAGALLGAFLANNMDAGLLQKVFGVFVLLMGARLILQGFKQRASE
jgi:uncharacterized membrane protein YfcA